jgi:hypothetical protein
VIKPVRLGLKYPVILLFGTRNHVPMAKPNKKTGARAPLVLENSAQMTLADVIPVSHLWFMCHSNSVP